ncbi:hypothetical protein EJ110_NYTH53233 [Nymphaea thermarum]|nr:hypothetical protein EJ110_NYTH53233 [Nymphaea thermarum]
MANSSNLLIMRLTIILVALVHSLSAKTLNVVTDYGAKADGVSDNSASFLKAWKDACSAAGEATVYVPSGQFLVRPTLFSGPCVSTNITVQGVQGHMNEALGHMKNHMTLPLFEYMNIENRGLWPG